MSRHRLIVSENCSKLWPRNWVVGSTALIAAIVAMLGIAGLTPSSATASTTVSIYPTNTVPDNQSEDDPDAVELGVQFSVNVPGSVVGLKFYKSAQNTGTHVGTIWTSSGHRLVEATFTSESASGWQTVRFASPVDLTPNDNYVASYHTSTGYYAQQQYAFASGATLGNDVIEASKGVYSYGDGDFPTDSWDRSAYYVDVLFKPQSAPASIDPTTTSPSPTETSSSPSPTTPSTTTKPSPTTPTTTSKPSPTTPTTTSKPSPTTPTTTSSAPAPKPTAFPNATNTGVPAGTNLTRRGSIRITAAGTVLDNAEVDGCITLGPSADNVTIKNVLVKADSCPWLILNDEGAKNLVVVDSELDGLNNTTGDAAVAGYNYTLNRVNIHGTIDGGKLGDNVVIEDSYVHDLTQTATSHNDGFQSLGSVGVTIRHNTIIVEEGATSAIILSTGVAEEIRNVQIDGNLLGGGAFTVYGGYFAGVDVLSRVSGISITNNKFTTAVFPNSGAYGPLTSVDPPAVTVSGNTWYDGPNAGDPVNR